MEHTGRFFRRCNSWQCTQLGTLRHLTDKESSGRKPAGLKQDAATVEYTTRAEEIQN
jgi:hypothetical protein